MDSQVAALLRRHRTAAGLTQDELSIGSGVSVQAISTLERGTRRYPQLSTVSALAEALHLDADQRASLEAAASRRGKTATPDSARPPWPCMLRTRWLTPSRTARCTWTSAASASARHWSRWRP
ncbi:helix-turn-helix protein [Kribbella orskensis]|uniref:Helix-turn-helix protein n=1 Tax=Kribbella orskensis TaxID=2512216 RepID=A0ABY2BE90_9ACTN|nr:MULTISPECIES: helix-turn-helix transcriptional regulator [Kribbella]TCN34788.1 helix-turn-helix protein [Kribbella sp. VKM Ac-2500]TCO15493.1 helix-turn-helix protein [Kribbella orskensis]